MDSYHRPVGMLSTIKRLTRHYRIELYERIATYFFDKADQLGGWGQ